MDIIFNTDNHISGTEELEQSIADSLSNSMKHFDERLTRIEVYLSDENSHKGGGRDIKCSLEARPRGLEPVVVTNKDENIQKSVNGAIDKLKSALGSAIDRAGKQRG